MNKYYCTKCETVSVIQNVKSELDAVCKCGKEPVKHRLLSLKGKPTPAPVPVSKAVEVKPVEVPAAPKPVTKLDVSSGPVKSTASK